MKLLVDENEEILVDEIVSLIYRLNFQTNVFNPLYCKNQVLKHLFQVVKHLAQFSQFPAISLKFQKQQPNWRLKMVCVNISHHNESWVIVRPWMFKTANDKCCRSCHISRTRYHCFCQCCKTSHPLFFHAPETQGYLSKVICESDVFGKQHWWSEDEANILLQPRCALAHTMRLVIFAL